MARRTRGRRRARTMSNMVATTTTIAKAIATADGTARATSPTAANAIAARGAGLMSSSRDRDRRQHRRDGVVGGVPLKFGFGPQLQPVAKHRRCDRHDIVGNDEVASGQTRGG